MNRNSDDKADCFDSAEKETSKKPPDDSKKRSQRWRDNLRKSKKKRMVYKETCHLRYLARKELSLHTKNLLFIENCVDEKNKPLINTPVGLIRYSDSTSRFEIQLGDDCTALNMDGNGSYGLVVRKGLYCYKINFAMNAKTPTGQQDYVYICLVKKLYEQLSTQDRKRNTRRIHLSKPSNIVFENNSLNVISKIKDLKNCTAPYLGMSII